MIILQLAGGLGNQMFQYALYLQLKSLGREVRIDDVSGFLEDRQRDPALAPFGIGYERPSREELRRLLDDSPLPWDRVRRKLFGRKKKSYFEEGKLFVPQVLTWDEIYLEGYWQSEKYFQAVEAQVREAYDTDSLIAYLKREDFWDSADMAGQDSVGSVRQYLEEIESTCSVSVHVRRGDYLTPENQALFGGICTDAYYIEAIRQMRERYPQCRFYLFCNDREWGRQEQWAEDGLTRIRLPEKTESAGKNRVTDYAEFLLMSRCRHHILANSSFSWWASYLNSNPDKSVLVPDTWLNGTDCRDFYREDMQKVIL
ncbi:MAG: alpha-1,2-fucosyltransferase [Lachnospiraceae bacterium]|nr:alpha-1,2-fucosyltransferase [Lachnospiraceae bacterium]